LAGAVIDAVGVEYYEVPGLSTFKPVGRGRSFSFTLYAVGMDQVELCDEICPSRNGGGSKLLDWSRQARERGGCRIEASPVAEEGALPESFWLSVRLPQTRLHAWQWRVESHFRDDGTVYVAASNATAPEGQVFGGGKATRVKIELRPTVYSSSAGQDHGYVPFFLFTLPSQSIDASAFSHSDITLAGFNMSFVVQARLYQFSEVNLVDATTLFAVVLAFLQTARALCKAVLLVLQRLLSRVIDDSDIAPLVVAASIAQGANGNDSVVKPPLGVQTEFHSSDYAPKGFTALLDGVWVTGDYEPGDELAEIAFDPDANMVIC